MTACGDITSYFIRPRVMRWHTSIRPREASVSVSPRGHARILGAKRTITRTAVRHMFDECEIRFIEVRTSLVRIHLAGLIKEERGGCCGNRSSIIRRENESMKNSAWFIEYERRVYQSSFVLFHSPLVNKFFGNSNNEEEEESSSLYSEIVQFST